MQPRSVVSVRVLPRFCLALSFDDGFESVVDLSARVGSGGVFDALADPAYFSTVRVDPEIRTIVWPNGADLCPDVLRTEARPIAGDGSAVRVGPTARRAG